MACASCSKPALFDVSVFSTYATADAVTSVHCCRDHLSETIDRLGAAHAGHRIVPARLAPRAPDEVPGAA